METFTEDLKLNDFSYFYDEYFKKWQSGGTQRQAYAEIENRYSALFGRTRYSNFNSFKATYLKKLKP